MGSLVVKKVILFSQVNKKIMAKFLKKNHNKEFDNQNGSIWKQGRTEAGSEVKRMKT